MIPRAADPARRGPPRYRGKAMLGGWVNPHRGYNKLYRKVKHRYRPNLSPRQRPTAKARHDQAALAASAEARGATHRARPRSAARLRVRVNPWDHPSISIYL